MGRKAAMQMSLDVMLYLGVLGLDVTWNVQVVVVAFNLAPFHQSTIMVNGLLCIPSIHNALDVLLAQTVLCTIFFEAILCINKEDSLAAILVLFVYDDDGSWNACAKENVWRQSYDTLDIMLLDYMLADVVFCIATEKNTMWQNASTTSFICLH